MSSPIRHSNDIDPVFEDAPGRHREHQKQWLPRSVNCPKCKARLWLYGMLATSTDSCGFENYCLKCDACGIQFAGVVDPYDDVLLLSELPYDIEPRQAAKIRLGEQSGFRRVRLFAGLPGHCLDETD